jgi:hypothetical protein
MAYPFDSDPDMTDEEYSDMMQAAQEQPTGDELDAMFSWWEAQEEI